MSEIDFDTKIERAVRHTLHAVTQPDNRRLAQLRPPLPEKRPFRPLLLTWQKQAASLCVLALLLLGSVGLLQHDNRQHAGPAPALLTVTATLTTAPTQTAVFTSAPPVATATAVAVDTADALQPPAGETPPPPTPVSALRQSTN